MAFALWVEVGSVVFFGGYGNELLCGLGNVIGALDDLLGDQLLIYCRAAFQKRRLLALALQSVRAGR